MLDLTMPLPPDPQLLNRWAAEPVRQVFLPASTFIPNAKGYPVLPKATQTFLQSLMKVDLISQSSSLTLELKTNTCFYRITQQLSFPKLTKNYIPGGLRRSISNTCVIWKTIVFMSSARWKRTQSNLIQGATKTIYKHRYK